MQLNILTKLNSKQFSDISKIFYIACTQNIEDAISFADTNNFDVIQDGFKNCFVYNKEKQLLATFTYNL